MYRYAALLAATLAVTGCSIKQTVTPADLTAAGSPEICLIPAAGLRAGFHTAYQAELRARGFVTRELAPGSPVTDCQLTSSYTASWTWDLALYMSYANILVYADGRQVGQALYDSRWGGGRLDKFIDAETKIAELTGQLFPQGAALLRTRPAESLQAAEAPPSREQ